MARFMDESESKKENHNGQKRRFDPELLKKGLRCDLDQYEFLKQCSEKGDEGINEWNERRKTNREEDIYLEGAKFSYTHLNGVELWYSYLKKAVFYHADLRDAQLVFAHLEGAEFDHVKMQGSNFHFSTVDGETIFLECKINRHTWFYCVGLDNVRIDTATKQLLEYNIRRKNWEEWYKQHPKLKWVVKPFWSISDYGRSTGRIIVTFFGLALIFANIYYHWGRIAPPGIVENLFIDRNGIVIPSWLVPLRTLYFSIVTMTTLGFGDMYANAQSIWGHILLSLQVILGYVLLGALVTRFAVLFTAGGPAGKFADEKKNKPQIDTD